ncbi:MAG: fumarylacetoacetate hydrolase family protein [Bacteroidales bacterium]
MKIISLEPLSSKSGYFVRLKPDTVLLRNNESFFFPDFAGEVFCRFDLAVRIDKIGKFIKAKFASRYYSQFFPVVEFYAHNLSGIYSQTSEGSVLSYFDHSFAVSPFCTPIRNASESIRSMINGECVNELILKDISRVSDEAVEYTSQLVTLKIGDIVSLGMSSDKFQINIGSTIQLSDSGNVLFLDFEVK